MSETGWKTTAIIFIVLFVAETVFVSWSVISYTQEQNELNENLNECYYTVCGEYYDAYLDEENVCYCYDEDYDIVKTEYIK